MYYRVAGITMESDVYLPSYEGFVCEPAKADVTLVWRKGLPPAEGTDLEAGDLRVRRLREGWYIHPAQEELPGLIANADYTALCLIMDERGPEDKGREIELLIRIALECALIRRGYISLHSAAVALDGKAYAFTGPSGLGKSTRAGAWCAAFGAQLISGDRPLIDVGAMELCGVPWDGKERCFRNVRCPLGMICEVRRSRRSYARRMSPGQRRRLLSKQSFVPMWDAETSALQMTSIVRFAQTAPIVRIYGGPEPEDARAMRAILENNEIQKEDPDMKAKSGFVLRNVVGEHILMPTGDNLGQFKGTVVLNDVAAFVWEKLQNQITRDDLLAAILNEYNVEEADAARDLDALLAKLKGFGVIEEEA